MNNKNTSKTKCASMTLVGLLSLMTFVLFAGPVWSLDQEPTFHRDVEPILQRSCQACHREGGANYGGMIAPMPLLTYEQVRPWARSVARHVEARTMPPWHASEEQTGHFANERRLSETEIDSIKRWVAGGAPKGDAADAPKPIEWPDLSGWTIGEPDLILEMPERYFVADEVEDEYKYFRMKLSRDVLPKDRWIKAFEFRPGSGAVHHIILNPIGGIAPGTDATSYREGVGRRLEAGSTLTWEMHYHKEPGEGSGVWDRSRVALKFYDEGEEIPYPIRDAMMGNYSFEIPPGAPNHSVSTQFRFRKDSKILAFSPHMHLRGTAAHYEAEFPDGERRVLLDVPRYDFNWQTTYRYSDPLFVPKGTKLTVTTTWDNSPNNPSNPDPTQTVRYGEPTTDEMSFGFVEYVHATQASALASPRGLTTTAAARESNVWRDAELGLEYEIPRGLVSVPPEDAVASFSTPDQVPHVDIGYDSVGFDLDHDALAQVLLAEFGSSAEARRVSQTDLSGISATELVVDWELQGFPLTTLVAAVTVDGNLVSVSATDLRGASVDGLRELIQGLRLSEGGASL